MPYAVTTNLNSDEVHDLLLNTFQHWVEFAMGLKSINGRMLKFPSGRYAASITADRGPEGNIVAVYIEPSAVGSKEASIIEHGHRPVFLKAKMLHGRPFIRLKLRGSPRKRPLGAIAGGIRSLRSMSRLGGKTNYMRTTGPMRFNKRLATIWANNYNAKANYDTDWRTMSSKRGTAKWIIPAMPAYSAARLLRKELPPSIRERVIIPR